MTDETLTIEKINADTADAKAHYREAYDDRQFELASNNNSNRN